jgi:hypothetical protein
MKIHKTYVAVGLIIAFALFFELAAHASVADQSTEITFNQPIQVPRQVLPAGTYLFKLATTDDLNIVQIFSSDGTHLYATLETVPTERRRADEDPTISLMERGSGRPALLLKWFYAGDETGHEFVYSNQLMKEIAQDWQKTAAGNQPKTDSEAGGSN